MEIIYESTETTLQMVGVDWDYDNTTKPDPKPKKSSVDTGKISEEDARKKAATRAFRSGVLFTSPQGLGMSGGASTSESRKLR